MSKSEKSIYNSYRQYDFKLIEHHIGHTRLMHGHLFNVKKCLTTNIQKYKNQRKTIKHSLKECLEKKENEKNDGIYGGMEEFLGKNYKSGKKIKENE